MSTGSGDEEGGWAADKRDFVADRRDEVADERDRVADSRDRTADDREAELDKWERHLDARAAQLGVSAEESEASVQRAEARAGRSQARQDRDEVRTKRMTAAAERDEARKRRQADAPPTRLAMVFANIAAQLYDADSFDDVLSRIADAAVSTIAGCRMASVTLCERERVPNRRVHRSGRDGGGSSAVPIRRGSMPGCRRFPNGVRAVVSR